MHEKTKYSLRLTFLRPIIKAHPLREMSGRCYLLLRDQARVEMLALMAVWKV